FSIKSLFDLFPDGILPHRFYPHKKILNITGVKLQTDNNSYIYVLIVSDTSAAQAIIKEQVENERFSTITLLAGGVAHELGNPLNAISLRLQLMQKQLDHIQRSDKRDQLAQSVSICEEEIMRLDGIIKNFLQAIRPQKPVMHPLDLNTVIDHVLNILAPEIHNLHINIARKTPALPLILGDSKQLEEAVFNIVKNSIEAINPHGQISINCSYTDLQVILEIADNGHGIAADNLKKVSEPYFSTKQTGNGLGMMIVERILQEHRAIFTIQSNVDQGTKVVIIFPIKDPSLPLLNK
ncbi:MAG: ATP-binding protein, partial [Opitutales bacterium]|nr:ATP-binding protein [Opitutales bacterium]